MLDYYFSHINFLYQTYYMCCVCTQQHMDHLTLQQAMARRVFLQKSIVNVLPQVALADVAAPHWPSLGSTMEGPLSERLEGLLSGLQKLPPKIKPRLRCMCYTFIVCLNRITKTLFKVFSFPCITSVLLRIGTLVDWSTIMNVIYLHRSTARNTPRRYLHAM